MNMRLPVAGSLVLAALSLPSVLYPLVPASDADKVFVGKVSQGGMYEVEASRLAEQKAVAPDVKDLAATEVHDHTLVNRELKKIATQEGIPVAAALNATFQQRLEKLKSVSGSEFDSAYIADMQDIHDKDEKLFAQEAADGSDAFKSFAHQTDLIVKRHIGALHGLDQK
jgi:putative membrane protein